MVVVVAALLAALLLAVSAAAALAVVAAAIAAAAAAVVGGGLRNDRAIVLITTRMVMMMVMMIIIQVHADLFKEEVIKVVFGQPGSVNISRERNAGATLIAIVERRPRSHDALLNEDRRVRGGGGVGNEHIISTSTSRHVNSTNA